MINRFAFFSSSSSSSFQITMCLNASLRRLSHRPNNVKHFSSLISSQQNNKKKKEDFCKWFFKFRFRPLNLFFFLGENFFLLYDASFIN